RLTPRVDHLPRRCSHRRPPLTLRAPGFSTPARTLFPLRTMRPIRLALALLAAAPAAVHAQTPARPLRPVATYSIVARDSATGEIGVAVQSHWFSVGTAVPWAEAGVGAVATQSFVESSYGPLGLELMRLGRSGPEALRALVST